MQTILETLLANAVFAALLAAVVYGVTRAVRKPAVVHTLWLLVLLKLVAPPIVSIPIPVASIAPPAQSARERVGGEWAVAEPVDEIAAPSLGATSLENAIVDSGSVQDLESEPALEPTITTEPLADPFAQHAPVAQRPAAQSSSVAWMTPVLLSAWAAGSILWATTCYCRVRRFRRWLFGADRAPMSILIETQRLADTLGLRRCPEVRVIAGRVAPMALAFGGRAVILLPQGLIADVTQGQLSTLLAHELSHLHRRDHWVRRLETATMFVYWWHPALWLARRELHRAEESCCDAWVVWMFPERAREYGEALLATLDYLADGPRAMALAASGSADIGAIRRRFEMILRTPPNRRMSWVARIAVLSFAALILPVSGAITAKELAAEKPTVETEAGSGHSGSQDRISSKETKLDGLVVNADVAPIADTPRVAGTRKTIAIENADFHFRWCPPGDFIMGWPQEILGQGKPDDYDWFMADGVGNRGKDEYLRPHKVKLTRGFWILETEVTADQYHKVMKDNPSHWGRVGQAGARHPVHSVSWSDANLFCERMATMLGRQCQVLLPSEAQWEYACRAGTDKLRFESLEETSWHLGNTTDGEASTGPRRVATKNSNPWGIYDMLGNMEEWCADWFGPYPEGSVVDPTGPTRGKKRVVRGRSHEDSGEDVQEWMMYGFHAADRHKRNPESSVPDHKRYIFKTVGFRVVLLPMGNATSLNVGGRANDASP